VTTSTGILSLSFSLSLSLSLSLSSAKTTRSEMVVLSQMMVFPGS
jgi:hypothetical protein